MEEYNWTEHYDTDLTESGTDNVFRRYDIKNETGTGKVISFTAILSGY